VKPFVPSGRPKERTCLLASRSGTLAAVTTTHSTLAENINGSVAFSPLVHEGFVKPDPLMSHRCSGNC